MKVKYLKPKGSRIKGGSTKCGNRRLNNFCGLECKNLNLWWVEEENRWIKKGEKLKPTTTYKESSNDNIKNLKSAIRHIKKHNEIPKGTWFELSSRWIGYDIYIQK